MLSLSKEVSGIPSNRISPLSGLYKFVIKLNIVDLPLPLFPTKETVSLGCILNDISFSTEHSLHNQMIRF